MNTREIRARLDCLWDMIDEVRYAEEIKELASAVHKLSGVVNEDYFVAKLMSPEWPIAADPLFICNEDSQDDKAARAAAIFSLFLSHRLPGNDNKFLDLGCGNGHVVKQAQDAKVGLCVGYDISEHSDWNQWKEPIFTTDFKDVRDLGPYNVVLMFDVLDHVMGTYPGDVLRDARSVLAPGGVIVIRLHPWCSRHGTHLWDLNKAYAHMVFSDYELTQMGYVGLQTVKVINPDYTYRQWFDEVGLRIIWEYMTYEQSGPIFENNYSLKQRILAHYNDGDAIHYNMIEQVFRDFVLTA